MPRIFDRCLTSLLCAATLAVGGLSSGCAETATAAGAIEATKTASALAQQIPLWVQQAADAIQLQNSLNWGNPESVVVTDTDYVLLYKTSDAQRRANNGVPRMIVIKRSDQPQQL